MQTEAVIGNHLITSMVYVWGNCLSMPLFQWRFDMDGLSQLTCIWLLIIIPRTKASDAEL